MITKSEFLQIMKDQGAQIVRLLGIGATVGNLKTAFLLMIRKIGTNAPRSLQFMGARVADLAKSAILSCGKIKPRRQIIKTICKL